jgi:putative membrane protein
MISLQNLYTTFNETLSLHANIGVQKYNNGGVRMMFGCDFGTLGSYGWGVMILNLAITVGVVIGIVLLAIWLFRRYAPSVPEQGSPNSYNQSGIRQTPREILQVRYARGEITREQYHEMLSDLS